MKGSRCLLVSNMLKKCIVALFLEGEQRVSRHDRARVGAYKDRILLGDCLCIIGEVSICHSIFQRGTSPGSRVIEQTSVQR